MHTLVEELLCIFYYCSMENEVYGEKAWDAIQRNFSNLKGN